MKWFGLFLLAAAGAGFWAYTTILEREPPVISALTTPLTTLAYVGPEFTYSVQVRDEGRGVQSVSVWLRAADQEHVLDEQSYAGSLFGGAEILSPRRLEIPIRPRDLGVPEGRATLVVEAVDFSFNGNRAVVEAPLVIDTQPPRISVQTLNTNVRQGGAELAVYAMDEEATRHGVMVGDAFYPGFPHPSIRGSFAAFYAMPWQREDARKAAPTVVALDRAGNRSAVGLSISLIPEEERTDRIQLSDAFMSKKVAELRGGEPPEDVLSAYVEINNQMRQENAAQIRKICENSSAERLWSEPFLQLPNSAVRAQFAEQRTYVYEGEAVDQQVHLGFDLASTARAPVAAANDGVVAFSGSLGIYGETVIVDHGMGLFSLYGHLSEIAVRKGSAVARGESLGRTGVTGLAGGDHLHFGMLLHGQFVDPIEWFDPKWIAEHLEVKLNPPPPEEDVDADPAVAPAAPQQEL